MSVERIVFFSAVNNGDLHVSRELVKYTVARAREHGVEKFAYCHRNAPEILRDIDGLEHWTPDKLPIDQCNVVRELRDDGKTWALNTWYASSPVWGINGGGYGMTLNTLIALFKAHFKADALDIPWENLPVERFIPKMDWGKFHTEFAARFLDRRAKDYRKSVLFANGGAMSGQARLDNATTNALLERLVIEHRDVLFFYTDQQVVSDAVRTSPNAFPTSVIIGAPPWGRCDLNENAYIGSRCDVIIGRASGPYSFCLNTDVMLDTKKTMIALCDDERVAQWVYMAGVPLCKIWHLPQTNEAFLFAKISEALR